MHALFLADAPVLPPPATTTRCTSKVTLEVPSSSLHPPHVFPSFQRAAWYPTRSSRVPASSLWPQVKLPVPAQFWTCVQQRAARSLDATTHQTAAPNCTTHSLTLHCTAYGTSLLLTSQLGRDQPPPSLAVLSGPQSSVPFLIKQKYIRVASHLPSPSVLFLLSPPDDYCDRRCSFRRIFQSRSHPSHPRHPPPHRRDLHNILLFAPRVLPTVNTRQSYPSQLHYSNSCIYCHFLLFPLCSTFPVLHLCNLSASPALSLRRQRHLSFIATRKAFRAAWSHRKRVHARIKRHVATQPSTLSRDLSRHADSGADPLYDITILP